jgi:membrane-bound lytic murein transglycosylase A
MLRPSPIWIAAAASVLAGFACLAAAASARSLHFASPHGATPAATAVPRDGQVAGRRRFVAHVPAAETELGANDPLKLPDTQLEPLAWSAVEGWGADDHVAAFAAFAKSCAPFLHTRAPDDPRPIYRALWNVCRRAASLRPESAAEAQAFFEENFHPVAIARIGEGRGLLTGYWEPVVEGSRMPNPEFYTPLYRRPRDLLVNGHPPGREVPNRAVINRRDERGQLVPYYDRAAIEAGALDGQQLEICWLRDPFDVLAIQIQGSARIILEDGTTLRVNYDSHNGHQYAAIGRFLIEQREIPADQMSMERIRQWMLVHPDEAPKLRGRNPSYVFFRITGLSGDGEAVGGQGVPLSPGRSIAVDRLHVYGTPFFISADLPIDGDRAVNRFRRLMIAQDTGSAILGPARADLYWGAGDAAGRIAGRIRHQGRFVMLLPAELDMVEAGRHMPLPLARPPVPAAMAKANAKAPPTKADVARPEASSPRHDLVRHPIRTRPNSGI